MRRAFFLTFALLLVVPGVAGAAKTATFSGSLGVKVPRGAVAEVRAVDRATGVVAKVDGVGRDGRFTLKLAAGAYTVVATVVRDGARPIQVVSSVTLKAGQRRAKANLKKSRRKKKPKRKAKASYVQERGQVTPGRIAIEIPDVTGNLSGDFAGVRRGINDLATTDIVGDLAPDCGITVLEVDRRADAIRELEFQQSKYVDPSTRVTRNFALGDVEVSGRARQVDIGRIEVEYTLTDKRTGTKLGSVKGRAGGDAFFDQLEDLSRDLGKELCKLSDTYEVTLDVRGTGNFATHSSSATMQGTLVARRPNRKVNAWTQTGAIAWANPGFSSKVGCPYVSPIVPAVTWTALLQVKGDDALEVAWGLLGSDGTTASIDCPPSGPGDPDPPPIPGQPGTALINTGPATFTLPFSGGTQQISGGVSDGADGFFNTGTIVVKPGPIVRVDD